MPSETPKRRVDIRETGQHVRRNVQRLRKGQGLSHAALAARMGEVGYPVSRTAISEIENGARRVSVDDLTALSAGLGVNPNALLLPPVDHRAWSAKLTGTGPQATGSLWAWARGEQALWPYWDDATGEEREALRAYRDDAFRQAITPAPVPDDALRDTGAVFHPIKGPNRGDG